MKLLNSACLCLLTLAVVADTATTAKVSRDAAFSCQPSPAQDLLPDVVGPMIGTASAWLVDGSGTWRGDREPVKTLWVLRRTSDSVHISGQRTDGPGSVKLRRGNDAPSDVLFVANAARESVIPGGAPPAVMRSYAFVPSHVYYQSPGCWQFSVRIAKEEFHIVRELKPSGAALPILFMSPPNMRAKPTALNNSVVIAAPSRRGLRAGR
jgi:hypothetical protein